jgi:hypothetical protein
VTGDPYIVQRQSRKAVIDGNRVHLFRVRTGNKKRPVDVSVLPDLLTADGQTAWLVAMHWLKNCYVNLENYL